jgi:hydrogenase nickel incorporation protein HypA/HybF
MHELSIALSILDLAAEEAERRGGVRVLGIHLKLGLLSGVVKDALLSSYDLARETSATPEAQLIIEEVPVQVYCPQCAADRRIESIQNLCCPECGTVTPDVVSGRNLEVFAMEIT